MRFRNEQIDSNQVGKVRLMSKLLAVERSCWMTRSVTFYSDVTKQHLLILLTISLIGQQLKNFSLWDFDFNPSCIRVELSSLDDVIARVLKVVWFRLESLLCSRALVFGGSFPELCLVDERIRTVSDSYNLYILLSSIH